ncbi:alpha/beta fold hydrolase [Actinoplanes sp. GCM10030250]|uniref:alpha/beta fold hydrolase n=1 Tax=Actinoplanes sp. GCM10030250 TaxID=3273376 RepID=UPI003619795B
MTLSAGDGTRIVARRTGRGEPVVLVHGSNGGLDSWDPIVPLLAGEYELWVYARRGYPPSGASRDGKTFADDLADLRAVLDAAGGSAHVVGASYGAVVALHAGRDISAGTRTLTAFEPPLFAFGAAVAEVLTRYRDLLARGDLAAATLLFAAEVARVPEAMLAALAGAAPLPAAELAGSLHDLEAMAADVPDLARWAGLEVPVTLIQGSETWSPMPETMDALGAAMPFASRVVLPGQSHFATHTAPEMFAEVVRQSLGR